MAQPILRRRRRDQSAVLPPFGSPAAALGWKEGFPADAGWARCGGHPLGRTSGGMWTPMQAYTGRFEAW